MYYLLGGSACYDVLHRVVKGYLPRDWESNDLDALRQAYLAYLKWLQPSISRWAGATTLLVDDRALEDCLIRGFYNESPLDDLARYRDVEYFQNGPELRVEISADVDYVRDMIFAFAQIDRPFWRAFGIFVNYVFCPRSAYSRGGSDSGAIGAVFLAGPQSYSVHDLYETIVHEFTHTVMFMDELSRPHYVSEALLPHSENFAKAVISELQRPLDKVLHSVVVCTEVLLHRTHTLGSEHVTAIHPQTQELSRRVLASIESMLGLPNREDLLTPHAFWLLERCALVAKSLTT